MRGSAATDLAKSERRAALGGPRRSANRATPSASRGVRRERLAYAATKVRLAPYLRRDSGAMHTARPSDRRSGSGAQPQQRRARNELRSRWPRHAAGPTNSSPKPANDRVIGYDEPTSASERSARGERPGDRERRLPTIASPATEAARLRGASVTAAPGWDRKASPGVRVSPVRHATDGAGDPPTNAAARDAPVERVSSRRGCASTTRVARSPCRRGRA